jgi:predicted component of type VI protein secretion system
MQLHILAGPQQGQRLRLAQTRITFGRAADNTLVLDQSFVSRYHGSLEYEDDQWWLINHSPNGTRLGKKKVTKKPRLVRDQAVVTIGEQPLFQVLLHGQPTDAAATATAPSASPEASASDTAGDESTEGSSRAKLWIGIGVYLAAMLALFITLATLTSGDAQATANLQTLSRQQVAKEIRSLGPSPGDRAPSARQANQYLQQATANYNMRQAQADALYRAHLNYQRAQAYSPAGRLSDGAEQARALQVEKMLIEQTQQQYRRALTFYRDQRYDRAIEAFRELKRQYPATGRQRQSTLFQNVERYIGQARQSLQDQQ